MVCENISIYQHYIGCSIEALAEEVHLAVSTVVENPSIIWRIKNPETLRKKMDIKNTQDVFLIDDVYGIRVVVDLVDEAYLVLSRITRAFSGFLDHDYIVEPKTRSDKPHLKGKKLRFLQFVAYKNTVPFEIQITTRDFHKHNELLHAEYHHEKYS